MRDLNLTMLQLIPCTSCNVWKRDTQGSNAANTVHLTRCAVTHIQERRKLLGYDSHDGLVLQNHCPEWLGMLLEGYGLWQPICKQWLVEGHHPTTWEHLTG